VKRRARCPHPGQSKSVIRLIYLQSHSAATKFSFRFCYGKCKVSMEMVILFVQYDDDLHKVGKSVPSVLSVSFSSNLLSAPVCFSSKAVHDIGYICSRRHSNSQCLFQDMYEGSSKGC
jgi:hypothetical protein